ncbi:MAG: hypothetical protein ACKO5E_13150 [bacterium]
MGQSPELGAADGAVKWSPDGQWLAMRQEFTNQFSPLETSGWLFRPELFLRENAPEKLSVRQSSIWIGRTDLKAWYKVAETGNRFEFLSQPCWALDGLSLYYAAVEKTGNTGKMWRIYQLGDLNDISNPQIVWEKALPDGWAVPEPGQKLRMILSRIQAGAENQMIFADAAAGELVLFRASSGEVISRFPDCHNARLSPNGDYVLWLKSAKWPATDAELGQTRIANGLQATLVERVLPDTTLHFSSQAPNLFVTRHVPPPRGMPVAEGADWPEISRVSVQNKSHERFITFDPVDPKFPLRHITFTMNSEEDTLIYAVNQLNKPVEIVWFLPKTSATYKKFPPLDMQTQVSRLSMSPEKLLAMRFGKSPETYEFDTLPAGLVELGEMPAVVPLAPDESSVRQWAELVVTLIAKTLYQDSASTGMGPVGPKQDHYSLVPRVGEFQAGTPIPNRLERFSRLGFRVLGLDPMKPDVGRIRTFDGWKLEAGLLFLMLTNHHREASQIIDSMNVMGLDNAARGRYFALKAQEKIETGDLLESVAIVQSLLETETQNIGAIEFNGLDGWKIQEAGTNPWAVYLKLLKVAAENPPQSAQDRSPTNPFGHFNPDDPTTDPDLKFPKMDDGQNRLSLPNRPQPLMRIGSPRGLE